MEKISEVAPGIFRIRQSMSRFKFSMNTYIIPGPDGLVVDPGFGSRRAGRALERGIKEISNRGRRRGGAPGVTRAMASHSHWDHFAGLAYLQEQLGLEILATDRQAPKVTSRRGYDHSFWNNEAILEPRQTQNPWYRVKNAALNALCIPLFRIRFAGGPVTEIREGQRLQVNGRTWEIIPVPGHCDDDIALFNADTGILLSGDLVFGRVATWLGPERSDLALYLESLERIRRLTRLRVILPAHGSPIENPEACLAGAVAHRHERTELIRDIVAAAGRRGISFEAVYEKIYPGHPLRRAFWGGWIAVTLKYLRDRGRMEAVSRGGRLLFRSA